MAEKGRVPHALLFSGQEKLGKKTIALNFISLLFGEDLKNHPDLTLIEPPHHFDEEYHGQNGIIKEKIFSTRDKNPSQSGGGQIQINQIRDLFWRLALKPIKASLKVAIINQAHLMTREAQNCFLKTLEEPRGNSLLILITEYPNFLLPTILSRCQIIKFYPVNKEEIRNFLKDYNPPTTLPSGARAPKISEEKIEEICEISLGRPGIVIDFLQNPEKLKERETKIKELIKISNSPIARRFQYAKELSQKENLKEVLNIWLGYFRQDLISQKGVAKTKNILQVLQKTFFLISTTNVNPRLALEIFMLEL
jgi:DNA polymerase-3 subunit delta'